MAITIPAEKRLRKIPAIKRCSRKINPIPLNKILIIRFSSIGDIVLTTPVVRCLKQQLPDGEIHFLTKPTYRFLTENNPFIDKCRFLTNDTGNMISSLKKEKYDFVIDLHHNIRSMFFKLLLFRKSYSFPKLNIEKWLTVNFKMNCLPAVHIVDRYMETVKPLGVFNDDKGLDYFIPSKDEVDINTLPATHRNGYIGLVTGGKYKTKCLPAGKLISICQKINAPVVLLGGKEDRETGELITAAAGEKIFNCCGLYNVNQSASLIRQAKKIITHDTGLMHIAAAFQKEILVVWGNTIPQFGMYPYFGNTDKKFFSVEVNNLPCRPCSKIGFKQCPKKHFRCMNLADEQKIKAFAENGWV